MINATRLEETFIELIKVPGSSRNEKQIADLLTEKITNLGYSVKEDDAHKAFRGTSGNLFVEIPGNVDGPTLLISAHLDTVIAGGVVDPIKVGDVIKSKGNTILGADDRAGLAVILELLQSLKENHAEHPPIILALTVCEEIGLLGATELALIPSDADMGVILDTSGPIGTIVYAAPYHESWTIEIKGDSAHAGIEPEKGLNAILLATDLIQRLPNGRIDEDTTANIARISGGTANNIVPDKVVIHGEYRSVEEFKLATILDAVESAVRTFNLTYPNRATLTVAREYDGYKLDPNCEIIQRLSKAARAIGKEPIIKRTGGGSDANVFNLKGIPCSVISCGMQDAHTHHEQISVTDLVDTAKMVWEFVTI